MQQKKTIKRLNGIIQRETKEKRQIEINTKQIKKVKENKKAAKSNTKSYTKLDVDMETAIETKSASASESESESKTKAKGKAKQKINKEKEKGKKLNEFLVKVRNPLDRARLTAAVIGNGVDVAKSLLPNAGRGLFATRSFHKGDAITAMSGHVIPYKDALKLRYEGKSAYLASHVPMHSAILLEETAKKGNGAAQFANHDREHPNAKLQRLHDKNGINSWPYLMALKDIKTGDEILYNYGKLAVFMDHSTIEHI